MPVKSCIAVMFPKITAWQLDIRRHPGLLFEVHCTAARIADLCRHMNTTPNC